MQNSSTPNRARPGPTSSTKCDGRRINNVGPAGAAKEKEKRGGGWFSVPTKPGDKVKVDIVRKNATKTE